MKNFEIVMMQTAVLIEAGTIGPDDIIHTWKHWQDLGYHVKPGEKSFIKFPIWKYTKKKNKEMTEEEAQEKGYCFMKTSAWFTQNQVITEEEYKRLYGK